jgi:hypothetical protein
MATLDEVRHRLLALHKTLVDAGRRDYERVHGRQTDPAFLEVLVRDPDFAWLGALTTLIARLDEIAEESASSRDALLKDCIEQIRKLLVPAAAGAEFNRRYEQLTQQVPEVLVAHGALMQALRA